ncbi:polyphosphate kinase 2 [Chelativorans intermedius]|uniref:ADP/GDP-polyphosphate phosphotransferase n=1 Tax=Chelativorans intermedius TaxID=515947 RepID=A0ABV6DC53_9HYPH|nr:polyphosphate kinase 2 [Chelativorans intermedius]MCT9000067.1 polyphosphate kinase 2 [Chelativorans intermedius]
MTKPLDNTATQDRKPMTFNINGVQRTFDIDDPALPGWVEERALTCGGYPYGRKLEKKVYKAQLRALQIELVKLQGWLRADGGRVVAVFEGRDAAGKGGSIKRVRDYMSPRTARNVALPKPTETERGQWYFQRYAAQLPTAGEFVTFDRSWYNRGVVEPVMGFCTPEEHERFLAEAPQFERMIVNDGIHLFKFWLNIGRETQLKRFHARRHSPLKHWKFSAIDMAAMEKWDEITRMRDLMIERTHTEHAPWTVVLANDKRRARLAVIRHILTALPYPGRDMEAIGEEDGAVVGSGPGFLR